MLPKFSTQIVRQSLLAGTFALMSSSNMVSFAQIIIMPNSGGNNNTELDRAKLIIETLRGRSDVRNINLKTDPDRKVTGVCYEQQELWFTKDNRDNANHPGAYADGYREGRMNAQKGEKYVARSGGGEFSRGFDDGYYGNKSTGQDANATVKDSSEKVYEWNKKCADV